MVLTCPNCKSPLIADHISYKCQSGHNFDKSKAGYINLLLPNQKNTLDPGDNKKMIQARELFLNQGYYDTVIEHLNNIIDNLSLASTKKMSFLDLGCGSGYYTRNIAPNDIKLEKIGLDISKHSIETAAKRDKISLYLVASAFNLPISDNSIDLITNIFSPIQLNEVKRILKNSGFLIKVIPGANHMKEIALLVYDSFKPHNTNFKSEIIESEEFELKQVIEINKTIEFDHKNLINLINMTPYKYKFSEDKINNLNQMNVTISFQLLIVKLSNQ